MVANRKKTEKRHFLAQKFASLHKKYYLCTHKIESYSSRMS